MGAEIDALDALNRHRTGTPREFWPIKLLPEASGGTESLWTLRWNKADSNLYGVFPVKWCFGLLAVLCSERERPFFVPSPTIRFAERAEGVKGPKR
jgi:hypothetical protein